MTYVPELKYVFCVPRAYPIENMLALWAYMNKAGVKVDILAGGEPVGGQAVLDTIREKGIQFNELRDLPVDYDVMISNCFGFFPFSRYWLEKSMQAGKINVHATLPSLVTRYKDIWWIPKRWKLMHALCVGDQRTAEVRRFHNSEVLYLNTGVPAWDYFSTDDFKAEVAQVKQQYGKKLLVIGVEGFERKYEESYFKDVIKNAENLGFKVIVQVHADKVHIYGDSFSKYANPGINRYALFMAASHVISALYSVMLTECFYLGTKVACKPLATHYEGWRDFRWLTDPKDWDQWARSFYDKELMDVTPLIHDNESLREFLSYDEPNMNAGQAQNYFGWPKVESNCENAFRMLDMYFGKENEDKVKRILKKNTINKNSVIDFSFYQETGKPVLDLDITEPSEFIYASVELIKRGDIGRALKCLNRAEMFSGMSHFTFVQYLLAVCHFKMNKLDEADKCIYQSLFVEPERVEFQNLKVQIDAAKQIEKNSSFQAVS